MLAAEGYPASPRTGDVITGLDVAAAVDGVTVFHAGTAATTTAPRTAGGRVLDVTATGVDLDVARTAPTKPPASSIHGMHYRRTSPQQLPAQRRGDREQVADGGDAVRRRASGRRGRGDGGAVAAAAAARLSEHDGASAPRR